MKVAPVSITSQEQDEAVQVVAAGAWLADEEVKLIAVYDSVPARVAHSGALAWSFTAHVTADALIEVTVLTPHRCLKA